MNKDWTWSSKAIYTCHWASNHSEWEREENDYYATDPKTIDDLVGRVDFQDKHIWECACGEGHLSKRLEKHWLLVKSTDLIERWYWVGWLDFLKCTAPIDCHIITNPPYKIAKDFIEHSLNIIPEWNKVAMFLKLTFLEWMARNKFFKAHPPKTVFVYSKRQMCAKNWEFEKYKSNAVAYCWFVWEKWFTWKPNIEWII